MRIDLVFNPNSGRGLAGAIAESLAARLRSRGHDVTPLSIAEFFANPAPADRVIALGGDGTVRAIVEATLKRDEPPPIAVVALGTANLVAQHLKLPWAADHSHGRLVDALERGQTYAMDVPLANGRPFLVMCSVGFDARVVHELATHRTGPITKLHYLPAVARSWLGFAPHEVEVVADGQLLFPKAPAMVVVANAAEYGTGFSMNPHATTDDGLLDVSVFTMDDRKHLITAAFHAAVRQVGRAASVLATARAVEIRGATDVHAQIDGEPFGHPPIAIELLRRRQPFIVAPRT